jgi:hypothetical protein
MSESYEKGVSNFYRLWQRFRNKVIQDVPEDIQLCEFDCHNLECAMGDWEKCEKRLRSIEQTQKNT